MTNNDISEISELAEKEAQCWEDSQYYDDAEKWNHVFWGDQSLFLKLFMRLNLERTLELACGHGRHSEIIFDRYSDQVNELILMDILQSNLDFCQNRIKNTKARFIKNDGAHFHDVPDDYCTAVFCYDAMVHFDESVVQSYIREAHRVLEAGGLALFHHSNYGEGRGSEFFKNPHARAYMTSELFNSFVSDSGLKLIEQHIINWGYDENLDAISLLMKA